VEDGSSFASDGSLVELGVGFGEVELLRRNDASRSN